jgi:hypothetical protein
MPGKRAQRKFSNPAIEGSRPAILASGRERPRGERRHIPSEAENPPRWGRNLCSGKADTSHLRATLPAMRRHPFTVPVVVTGYPTDVTIVASNPHPVTVMVSTYPYPAGCTNPGSVVTAAVTSRVVRVSVVVGRIFRENHTKCTPSGVGQISISSRSCSRFGSSGSRIVRSCQYSGGCQKYKDNPDTYR